MTANDDESPADDRHAKAVDFYRAVFAIEVPRERLYRRAARLGLWPLTHVVPDAELERLCDEAEGDLRRTER